MFQLGSYQIFGVPLPIKDDDKIQAYAGLGETDEVDLVNEELNYTAITGSACEVFKLDLDHFMELV